MVLSLEPVETTKGLIQDIDEIRFLWQSFDHTVTGLAPSMTSSMPISEPVPIREPVGFHFTLQ